MECLLPFVLVLSFFRILLLSDACSFPKDRIKKIERKLKTVCVLCFVTSIGNCAGFSLDFGLLYVYVNVGAHVLSLGACYLESLTNKCTIRGIPASIMGIVDVQVISASEGILIMSYCFSGKGVREEFRQI